MQIKDTSPIFLQIYDKFYTKIGRKSLKTRLVSMIYTSDFMSSKSISRESYQTIIFYHYFFIGQMQSGCENFQGTKLLWHSKVSHRR